MFNLDPESRIESSEAKGHQEGRFQVHRSVCIQVRRDNPCLIERTVRKPVWVEQREQNDRDK